MCTIYHLVDVRLYVCACTLRRLHFELSTIADKLIFKIQCFVSFENLLVSSLKIRNNNIHNEKDTSAHPYSMLQMNRIHM